MSRDARNSKAFRTYPSSPRGFDPHKASDEELLRYGFPQRPDPDKHPELARLWKRALARPIRFVEAKLSIDPVMGARGDPLIQEAGEFGPTGWAGALKLLATGSSTSDFTQPATMVFAQWQVPYVYPVHPAGETDTVAFWVGLDGYAPLNPLGLLQAGVAADVHETFSWWPPFRKTVVTWWAWTEWYSDSHAGEPGAKPHKVETVPVAPGDTIFVVVCAPQPDFGFVSMLNISRGIGSSVGINALSGVASEGKTADWMLEVPSSSPNVPIFSPVTFTNCTAGSLEHGVFNLTDGIPMNITAAGPGPYGHPITKTTIGPADPPPPNFVVVEELEVDW